MAMVLVFKYSSRVNNLACSHAHLTCFVLEEFTAFKCVTLIHAVLKY